MESMNNFDLDINNLLDFKTTNFDIAKLFDNVYVPVNGKYKKILNVVGLGNNNIDDNNKNKYLVTYNGADPKEITVNNLFDL